MGSVLPMKTDCSRLFPGAQRYAALRQAPTRTVREAPPEEDSFPYSERHLQCVWFDAAYRPGCLRSLGGEEIVVEEPGRWNLEAGPDFLDAVLRVGVERRRVQGDVEVHVHPRDWDAHRHADDPRYGRVVAHVSYYPGPAPSGRLPAAALQIALRAPLQSDPRFSFENIDLTAYPYAARPAHRPACAEILEAWPPPERAALLRSAGEERLRIKAGRMRAAIRERGGGQAFYEEVMAAQGYKQNSAAFRQLARRLPAVVLQRESGGDVRAAYALLLGVAGLAPARVSSQWDEETRAFVRALWDTWWKRQAAWEPSVMPRTAWRLAGQRPQNHPARRLAAAAVLFAAEPPLGAALSALDPSRPVEWFRQARDLLKTDGAIPYWNRRLGFSSGSRKANLALLGAGRVSSLIANIVIPFLAATGRPITPLLDHLEAEDDNAHIRQTAFSLFGRDHNPLLHRHGLLQQGLLQIFHDFCLNRRTGCANCRLVEALKESGWGAPGNGPA